MRTPEFWQTRGPLARMLAPLGTLYGASVKHKAAHAHPWRAKANVLCVGNLTAGGSGKTPVAMALAETLSGRGKKVFFLTRGYGGREAGPLLVQPVHDAAAVGDEALLLAARAPTIVAADRAAGARLADSMGADVIIMDDGHQNFSLAKDVSLVVVDGAGFGNGLMIPAGALREPVSQGLARADGVIIVGDGNPDLGDYKGPVLRVRLEPQGDLAGRYFAFAGIGRPEKFLNSLKQAGIEVTGHRFFPDHHPYRAEELTALKAKGPLVTTEKDYVRLAPAARQGIAVLKIAARFDRDPAPLLKGLA